MKTVIHKRVRTGSGLVQESRLAAAAVILCALVFFPGYAAWAEGVCQTSLTDLFLNALSGQSTLVSGQTAQDGSIAAVASSEYLESVDQELFDIDSYTAVQIDEDAGLLGFESDEASQLVLAALQKDLAEKGWSVVSSSDADMVTFTKSSGAFRWCCVSAMSVSGKTVAVIKVQ